MEGREGEGKGERETLMSHIDCLAPVCPGRVPLKAKYEVSTFKRDRTLFPTLSRFLLREVSSRASARALSSQRRLRAG